jgi:hypothetical protein
MLPGNNLKISAILSAHARAGDAVGQQPKKQCLKISARQGAAIRGGGRRHLTLPAMREAAGRRQGPRRPGAGTCRRRRWRHPPAGSGSGGTSHVSPAQGCRHSARVLFGKYFHRWSFLTIHWGRWSDSSKIPGRGGQVGTLAL